LQRSGRDPVGYRADARLAVYRGCRRARIEARYREQYRGEAVPLDSANSEDAATAKDRIKGSAEQAKGAVKEAAGKVFGDKKLETEGKTDKAVGNVQNAGGRLKDAVRGK
jgi:uncharacterized protein YjbJ (UPF0337 family)